MLKGVITLDHIYLIGFMGSGKSTIGKSMRDVFKYKLFDMDVQMEERYRKSISDIMNLHGEKIFRNLETGILYSIDGYGTVVATGGGIVEKQKNIEYMKYTGYIVFLQASFKTIEKRLKNDTSRPLWNTDRERQKELFSRREQMYIKASDFTIQTNNRTPQAISRDIYLLSKRLT